MENADNHCLCKCDPNEIILCKIKIIWSFNERDMCVSPVQYTPGKLNMYPLRFQHAPCRAVGHTGNITKMHSINICFGWNKIFPSFVSGDKIICNNFNDYLTELLLQQFFGCVYIRRGLGCLSKVRWRTWNDGRPIRLRGNDNYCLRSPEFNWQANQNNFAIS